ADEDGVVLPAAGENVHHLPDLEIAAEHGIDPPLSRALGEIHRELIEVGCFATSRARLAWCARRARCSVFLARARDDRGELGAQLVERKFLKLAAHLEQH